MRNWNVSPQQATEIQKELAKKVVRTGVPNIKTIAGADIAIDEEKKLGFGGVIVYSYPELRELERAQAVVPLEFPYIPGLLAFREGPVLLKVFESLKSDPDLIMFDGQGIAHPRRLGIASHLGLILDKPTIGCAKKVLVGKYQEPDLNVGSQTYLMDKNEEIGACLRTRFKVKPIFVSIGHKIDLTTAVEIVLKCGDGKRIPKPTREADQYVAKIKM